METIFETIEKNRQDAGNIDIAVAETNSKIASENPKVNAIVWQDENFTKSEIERVKKLSSDAPLFGLPLLVKELDGNILDTENSWGNAVLKKQAYKDKFTSTTIRLLQDAGAVIVGKTNSPELGLDVITNSKAHGPCLCPQDTSRNSGGSSGGAAAAVATAMTRIATASDGGGSARIPAAVCGVFGYKSSRGRISQGPIIGHGWAGLAQKGLIGASIKEMAYVADLITAPQPGDPYNSAPIKTNFYDSLTHDLPKLKIAIRTSTIGNISTVNKEFIDATINLGNFLSAQGHEVATDTPLIFNEPWVIKTFEKIIYANTVTDFKEMVKRSRGELKIDDCSSTAQYFYTHGKDITADEYINCIYDLEYFTRQSASFFEDYDILITPTIADYGTRNFEMIDNEPPGYDPYTYAGFTSPINFIGGCAIAVPVSSPDSTLPLSVQIASKRDNDQLLFQICHYLECNYPNIYSISRS